MSISNKKNSRRNFRIFVIVCILIGLGMLCFLFLHYNKKVTTVPSTSKQQDEASVKEGISQKNSNSAQASGNDKRTNSGSSSSSASSPQGNFVSSHHVNLSSTIESVCVTTKGADCEIIFNQNGINKSLGKKTVDNNGSATWLWTPDSINLTVGSWAINATSSINGSQSTAKDPLNLEVRQ